MIPKTLVSFNLGVHCNLRNHSNDVLTHMSSDEVGRIGDYSNRRLDLAYSSNLTTLNRRFKDPAQIVADLMELHRTDDIELDYYSVNLRYPEEKNRVTIGYLVNYKVIDKPEPVKTFKDRLDANDLDPMCWVKIPIPNRQLVTFRDKYVNSTSGDGIFAKRHFVLEYKVSTIDEHAYTFEKIQELLEEIHENRIQIQGKHFDTQFNTAARSGYLQKYVVHYTFI